MEPGRLLRPWGMRMGEREQKLDEALASLRERDLDPQSAGGAIALEFLLAPSGEASSSPVSPKTASPSPKLGSGAQPDGTDPVAALADWSGADSLRLVDFFEISDGAIRLTIPSGRLPRSKADQQRILTLLTLAIDRVALGSPQTSHRQVNAVLHDYAAFDQNLAKNVAKNSNLVIRSGKPKAHLYRVTQPGLDRARELIQILTSSDEVLPS
jgi:hypothetical protein